MKVLFLAAEVAPFAKVGGLADVAGSLPKALAKLGHDVRVMMPSYGMIEADPRWQLVEEFKGLPVRIGPDWTKIAYLKRTDSTVVPVYFLGTDQWFGGSISSQTVYLPGSDQHLFFARGALAACSKLDWIPDVIHCNDWHTGFTPVLLRETRDPVWTNSASVFTIHNLAYQGEFGEELLSKLDLSMELFNPHQLETYGRVNFLKAGCVYADLVNTVSPTYAQEIQTPEYGCRLDGLMRFLSEHGRLSGILNGIDTDEFNPGGDPHIHCSFSVADLKGKAVCKRGLLKQLSLPYRAGAPLMGVVSRMSSQKGMDLLFETAEDLFGLGCQLVVQGLGDPWIVERFRELQDAHPDHFRFVELFDPQLAQRIYAGSDMFLMPSSFEPCGLGQMIALRYGTIPIVRRTGGLADTVHEGVNGFVFDSRTAEEFLATCQRAVGAWNDKPRWRKLMKHGLSEDYSWVRSAIDYAALYLRALDVRTEANTIARAG